MPICVSTAGTSFFLLSGGFAAPDMLLGFSKPKGVVSSLFAMLSSC
jgi:hypothetical protein